MSGGTNPPADREDHAAKALELAAQVEALQQKLHEIHATDENTLRRAFRTISQHLEVLKQEATVLENTVSNVEPEVYPPEYIAEQLAQAGIVSGAVYGACKLLKEVPVPSKTSSWLRRGLVLAAVVIIGWRLAFGSVARFAKALKEHKQRRRTFLHEWEQLKHRIDILVSLTSTLPTPTTAVAGSGSTAGGPQLQPPSAAAAGTGVAEAAGAPQAAAAGREVPARVPTPGPNGGNGADFVMLELPRVDSGTGLSPLMSPAPEADQGGLPLPSHGRLGFTSINAATGAGVQGRQEQQGSAVASSGWTQTPSPAAAGEAGAGGWTATCSSSSSGRDTQAAAAGRAGRGSRSSSTVQAAVSGQQEGAQGLSGDEGRMYEGSTMDTAEGPLDEHGQLGGVPDPFRLGWGGVGARHGPRRPSAAAGGGGLGGGLEQQQRERGGQVSQLRVAGSMGSDGGWVMDSPPAAAEEEAAVAAGGSTSGATAPPGGGAASRQQQQEQQQEEEGDVEMEGGDEREGQGLQTTVSPTMSDAVMLDYDSGNGSE